MWIKTYMGMYMYIFSWAKHMKGATQSDSFPEIELLHRKRRVTDYPGRVICIVLCHIYIILCTMNQFKSTRNNMIRIPGSYKQSSWNRVQLDRNARYPTTKDMVINMYIRQCQVWMFWNSHERQPIPNFSNLQCILDYLPLSNMRTFHI